MPWDLIFFRQARGNEPVLEFLRGLQKAARMEAGAALQDLERMGPRLRRPGADYLDDGIYELRFSSMRTEYRILYFFDRLEIVLTNAFIKKTARVPRCEIELARARRRLWRSQ